MGWACEGDPGRRGSDLSLGAMIFESTWVVFREGILLNLRTETGLRVNIGYSRSKIDGRAAGAIRVDFGGSGFLTIEGVLALEELTGVWALEFLPRSAFWSP